ncbi:MAG: M81 family metallopeptidase [Thermomicrobiales bacterium]
MHETHTIFGRTNPARRLRRRPGRRSEPLRRHEPLARWRDRCLRGTRGLNSRIRISATRPPVSPDHQRTVRAMTGELLAEIERQLPADGIVLTLHGAFVADGVLEADAEIVRRVRALVGPDMPIAVTLDLHANIGPALVEAATLIVG